MTKNEIIEKLNEINIWKWENRSLYSQNKSILEHILHEAKNGYKY